MMAQIVKGVVVAFVTFFLASAGHERPQSDLPCVTHLESLAYEPMARKTAIEGDVLLQVDIDDHGTVSDERPISGHPLLLKEAEKNIKRWKFKNGKADTFVVTYEFRLVGPRVAGDPCPTISYDLPLRIRVTSQLPIVNP